MPTRPTDQAVARAREAVKRWYPLSDGACKPCDVCLDRLMEEVARAIDEAVAKVRDPWEEWD